MRYVMLSLFAVILRINSLTAAHDGQKLDAMLG
jgi:hypothetical protein